MEFLVFQLDLAARAGFCDRFELVLEFLNDAGEERMWIQWQPQLRVPVDSLLAPRLIVDEEAVATAEFLA